MKIGELAKLTGCSIQTIRHYEKEHLLEPKRRSEGNFRLFDQPAQEQLLFIKHCRSLGLSLAEIRELVNLKQSPSTECDDINIMIASHIKQVNLRIKDLHRLRSHLEILRHSCSSDRVVKDCGILQNLSHPEIQQN